MRTDDERLKDVYRHIIRCGWPGRRRWLGRTQSGGAPPTCLERCSNLARVSPAHRVSSAARRQRGIKLGAQNGTPAPARGRIFCDEWEQARPGTDLTHAAKCDEGD